MKDKLQRVLVNRVILFFACLSLSILSLALVACSSQRQSLTIDEATHYYCGLQWWEKGEYNLWPENPVLSRAIAGLGPFISGYYVTDFPSPNSSDSLIDVFNKSYNDGFLEGGILMQRLFMLRVFVSLMFLVSVIVVWIWTAQLAGQFASLLAISLYAFNPIIMAHSGLATTDISYVCCFVIFLFSLYNWIKRRTWPSAVFFGIGLGLSLLTKYTAIPFGIAFLLCITINVFIQKKKKFNLFVTLRNNLRHLSIAAFTASLLIIAFYHFSFGAIGNEPVIQKGIAEGLYPSVLRKVYLPAPEWFAGMLLLATHNNGGQMAYAAGEVSTHGFWWFYLFATLIKTPVPFFISVIAAIFCFKKRRSRDDVFIISLLMLPFPVIFLASMGNINLGIRHIAIIFPAVAISVSVILTRYIINGRFSKSVASLCVILAIVSLSISFATYPNYLSYFNLFGGREPGKYLLDSVMDWGQGLIALSDFCKTNKIDTLHIAYFGGANSCVYDLPEVKPVSEYKPMKEGWVAVSEQLYRGLFSAQIFDDSLSDKCRFVTFKYQNQERLHKKYRWLDKYPVYAIVGGSIRIYFIQPNHRR